MAQTWVTNNGNKPNFIGGKLLQPGEGTFVETPARADPEPAQVQAQLTGAGDLELVVDGARHRALSPAKAAAFDSLVSAPWNRRTSSFTHRKIITSQLQDLALAYNYHMLVTAEQSAEFDQARLYFQSNRTTTFAVDAIAAAATSALDEWTPTESWVTAAGPTVAARSAAGVHGVTPSAWLDVSSVPMANGSWRRLMLRAKVSAVAHSVTGTGASLLHGPTAGFTANGGRLLRSYSNATATDFTSTNQAGWVSGSLTGFSLITGYELRCRRKVLTFCTLGDSNAQGIVANRNLESWGLLMAQAASTSSAPIEYFAGGQSGQASAAAVDRFEAMLVAGVVPGIATFMGSSRNDGAPTAVTTNLQRKAVQKFLNLCEAYRILPIITTGAPNNADGWDSASDAAHLARQAEIKAMGDQGLEVWDIGALAADATNPARFALGASDDNTHYNQAMNVLIAATFAPRLAALAVA